MNWTKETQKNNPREFRRTIKAGLKKPAALRLNHSNYDEIAPPATGITGIIASLLKIRYMQVYE
jgi:hypothetical protein